MKRLLFLVVLLAAVRVQAAEPTPAPPIIQVPAQVEPYRKIEATLLGGIGIPMWQDIEGADVSEEANGTVLHIWAPPGTYKLKCVLLDIKSLAPLLFSKTTVRAEFTVGKGPDPEPKPEPKPNPPPPPSVAALYFIYETKDATPAIADVKDDKAWKDTLTAAKISWKVMDDEAAERQVPNATELARKKGLPAVVLVAADRTTTVLSAPQTKEAMRELVKQYRGGAQ